MDVQIGYTIKEIIRDQHSLGRIKCLLYYVGKSLKVRSQIPNGFTKVAALCTIEKRRWLTTIAPEVHCKYFDCREYGFNLYDFL